MFDFPHLQLTVLTAIALCASLFTLNIKNYRNYLFAFILTLCFIFQVLKIYSYTSFASFEVMSSSVGARETISIYTSNVLQNNKNYNKVISDTEHFNADVVLFTETDSVWIRKLSSEFDKKYPYNVSVPQQNTYGMLLLSKFKIIDENIRYLVEDTIPSIDAKLISKFGKKIQIYAIHPAPPTPHHSPTSVDRDAEMMKIAKFSRDSKYPVIVMGDFNDVAWSESTKLFQEFSGLLDLRKGRGLYNTYNADSWLLRWPLDHIFVSADFRVKDIQLGSHVGSDHFPFYTKLSLESNIANQQRLPPPSQDEIKEAFKQIEKEKNQ